MRYSILLIAILFIPVFAYSDTIIVPNDYPTIQGAIDASVNGDTVLVKPGTYVEEIDFKGKAIALISEHGPYSTLIDGNQAGSVVTCQSSEGKDTILNGFILSNGIGTQTSPYGETGGWKGNIKAFIRRSPLYPTGFEGEEDTDSGQIKAPRRPNDLKTGVLSC